MRFNDANAAADAIRRTQNRQREGLRPFRADVTGITSGLVELQRIGATDDQDAGYPILIPGAVEVGDEIVAFDLGGAPVVLGRLGNVDTPMIGQLFARSSAASAADTTSNTSTSAYVDARSATWSDIPDGTYDIEVIAGAAFSHLTSGNPHVRCTAGGINGTAFGSLSITSTREQLRYAWSFSDVAIAGGVTVALEYKLNGGSGTISARNPSLLALFTFKGA